VRSFVPSQNEIAGAAWTPNGLVVIGSGYDVDSEQPLIGRLDVDGAWVAGGQMAGDLRHPDEFEDFSALVPAGDGGWYAVGLTRVGTGGCATCLGNDGLVIRFDADLGVRWTRVIGGPTGDEGFDAALVLPDGDVLAIGAGTKHDYSEGAETDVDGGQAVISRLGPDGTHRWSRRPRITAGPRGATLHRAIVDPDGGVLVVGSMTFTQRPIVAHVSDAGALTWIREARVGDRHGEVTDVAIASDGSLITAGWERVDGVGLDRYGVIMRTNTTRDAVVWSRRFALADTNARVVRLLRSRRGDLVVAASGAGPDGTAAMVLRMDDDGNGPACLPTLTGTGRLIDQTDASIVPAFTIAPVNTVVAATTVGGLEFPVSPAPGTTCAP
jgi:hypothetical protein